jgi:membrane-associated phospholipid phosphatase
MQLSETRMLGLASPLVRRSLRAILVVAIQSLYFLSSSSLTGGIAPKLPFEPLPIWPVWVVPYVLCYPLWLLGLVLAIWRMPDRLFRALIAACVLTFGTAQIFFVAFPTYVERTPLVGEGFLVDLLGLVYRSGGDYDALPSGHIYITAILALFFAAWIPRWRVIWLGILLLVALSTLFTGQHYVLDLLAGYILAWCGFRFGGWWAGRRPRRGYGEVSGSRILR